MRKQQPAAPAVADLGNAILAAWKTSERTTAFLVEQLPPRLWDARVPGLPHRSIRMIASHLHNSRCSWIKTIGKEHGIAVPGRVDHLRVSRRDLLSALKRSGRGMSDLLRFGLDRDGKIPIPSTYVWRNLPLDVGHFLAYFVAHEGHHRGQIVLIARQLGHRLPVSTMSGLWDWTKRSKEAGK